MEALGISFCLLVCLFIGYCICKYLDSCKHTWELVSKDKRTKYRDRPEDIVGIVYIHEYKCEKCGIHKVTDHEVN